MSQDLESTEDVELVEEAEAVKTTTALRIIQIPIQMAQEEGDEDVGVAAEEEDAGKAAAGDEVSSASAVEVSSVSAIDQQKTLDQVADISADIEIPPISKDKLATPRASLDDVLDIPTEYEQPLDVASRKGSEQLVSQADSTAPAPAATVEQETTSVTEVTAIAQEEKEIDVVTEKTEETKEETVGEVVEQVEHPTTMIEIPMEVVAHPVVTTDVIEVPTEEEPAGVIEVPVKEEPAGVIEVPIKEEPAGVIEVPVVEEPSPPTVIDVPMQVEGDEAATKVEETAAPAEVPAQAEEPAPEPAKTEEKKAEVPTVTFEEVSKPAEEPAAVPQRPPVEIHRETEESADTGAPKGRQSRKKSRKEIEAEVQSSLANMVWDRGVEISRPSSRPPGYVTYASWAPSAVHKPAYTPYSTMTAHESRYRNRHTVAYTYVPPVMPRLTQFDDYVKIGSFAQGLWSTERAVQRSRSFDRRPPPGARDRTYVGPSPIGGRRAQQSAAYYSAPTSRSSSASCLLDYVASTRHDLRRGAESRLPTSADDEYESRLLPSRNELAAAPDNYFNLLSAYFHDKLTNQTDNYLRRLHEPYEATVPSYYGRYEGRPYSPYAAVPLKPERSFAHYITRELGHDPPSLKYSYENRLHNHVSDIYIDRDVRNRAERDRNYANFIAASPYAQRFSGFTRPSPLFQYPDYGIRKSYTSLARPSFMPTYVPPSSFLYRRY